MCSLAFSTDLESSLTWKRHWILGLRCNGCTKSVRMYQLTQLTHFVNILCSAFIFQKIQHLEYTEFCLSRTSFDLPGVGYKAVFHVQKLISYIKAIPYSSQKLRSIYIYVYVQKLFRCVSISRQVKLSVYSMGLVLICCDPVTGKFELTLVMCMWRYL